MQAPRARPQLGLTLVELLVSMVIMGFVLTLVSQAVFQVSQVTRSAQDATAELTGRWAGGWAVGPVISNLVAPGEAPVGKAFEGTAQRLSGYTTLPVDGGLTGVKPFVLELASPSTSPTGDTVTAMLASSASGPAVRSGATTVANFRGRAEFAYVDASGQLQPQWPPISVSATRDAEELPRAVLVRRPLGTEVLMWYPFQGSPRRTKAPSTPFGDGR